MSEKIRSEISRIEELRRLMVLDTSEEKAYDDLTRLAAEMCDTPIALISLVDSDRQWFKSRVGLQAKETPREYAFCAHAIKQPDEVMIVPNATEDPRFVENPLVTGDPNIRFYAGAPLVTKSGEALGTLCVIDSKPRELDANTLTKLQFLAHQVVTMLEARAEKLSK